tara:strand:+ start:1020 stop:2723 length:1704 start_codon:yes stop_codon:yes gene_type:complete
MISSIKSIFTIFNSNQKIKAYLVFFLIIFASILEAIGIGMIFPLITVIMDNSNESQIISYILIYKNIIFNNEISLINFVLIMIVLFFFLKNIFLFYINFEIVNFTTSLIKFFSTSIFTIYLKEDYIFHKNNNSSKLTRNIKTECERFGSLCFIFIQLLSEVLIIFSFLLLFIYLFGLNIIFILLLFFIIGFLFDFFTKGRLKNWGHDRQKYDGAVFKNIEEGFNSIKEIKLLNKENEFIKFFQNDLNVLQNANKKFNILVNTPKLLIEFISIFLIVIFCFYYLVININVGQTDFFASAGVLIGSLYRLIPSIIRIISYINRIKFDLPVIKIIKNEYEKLYRVSENIEKHSKKHINFKNNITFENVNFKYSDNGKLILNSLSFEIEKGKITGIFGKTGSGKSTLIDLILGIIFPSSGKIKIDGVNINEVAYPWRNLIGYVPQKIYLIDNSIKKNIAFSYDSKKININEVNKCIKISNLEELNDMIDSDDKIGQDGSRLSGGQKQRIGIARAFYNNPKIIILDEATNQLDENTQKKILNNIINYDQEITIIMVSHNNNHKKLCDNVIHL